MGESLVSVIVPTFERPTLLSRALESVMAQTHGRWEVLVVDDNGATGRARDETERFMERYRDDERVRYVAHEHNAGLPAARNTGIAQARGSLVAFLDDDDAWHPTKLRRQVEVFERSPDVALVYTGRVVVDDAGRPIRTVPADPKGMQRRRLLEENWVSTPSSVVCRRTALDAVGGFDAAMPSLEDWDFYLRLSEAHAFARVDEPLTIYYHHDGGRMMEDYATLARAYERLYEKHGAPLRASRRTHAIFLRRQAKVLLRAGRPGDARRTLWRALGANALDRRTLVALLQSGLGEERFAAVRRSSVPLRSALRRARPGPRS